jgi:hypothetical protein
MKRKPPKPKTPKTPRPPVAKKTNGAVKTQPTGTPTPSPEWLAEMGARILAAENFPLIKASTEHMLGAGAEPEEVSLNIYSGMVAAYRLYREARRVLDYISETDKALLVVPFFSLRERETGRVEFGRGCQLITGETKRQRAIQKYSDWAVTVGIAPVIDGKPCPQPNKDSGFLTSTIVPAMMLYEDFSKKPLDLEKSQYAPHPGHNAKTVRQKRKRRGPTRFRRGQK